MKCLSKDRSVPCTEVSHESRQFILRIDKKFGKHSKSTSATVWSGKIQDGIIEIWKFVPSVRLVVIASSVSAFAACLSDGKPRTRITIGDEEFLFEVGMDEACGTLAVFETSGKAIVKCAS